MHAWLPRAYVEAGPAVTALFSGLLTKAGVYVLYRLYSVVFAGDPSLRPAILALALLTMVVGVLGAVGRDDVRGILAFHMVSQVGYLILPLGLWTLAGVTAGLVYLLQYIVVKGALFLAVGAVETLTGTGRLAELGGMVRTRPVLAVGFLLPALALAGIPPTSGFVGKLLLLLAALDARAWLAAGLLVTVSLFTLLSMVKIWNGVFWGELAPRVAREPTLVPSGVIVPSGGAGDRLPPAGPRPSRGRTIALVAPSVVLGVGVVVLGLAAPWFVDLVEPAARTLLDPTPYLDAVRQG
jgi:multicomponent Na+:H+ antiporter subunit D